MQKEDFINFVETKSKLKYIRNSYGNYKTTDSKGNVLRYKIQANSVRHEIQLSYENFDGKTENIGIRDGLNIIKILKSVPKLEC